MLRCGAKRENSLQWRRTVCRRRFLFRHMQLQTCLFYHASSSPPRRLSQLSRFTPQKFIARDVQPHQIYGDRALHGVIACQNRQIASGKRRLRKRRSSTPCIMLSLLPSLRITSIPSTNSRSTSILRNQLINLPEKCRSCLPPHSRRSQSVLTNSRSVRD
jgi:hypothetical protein